MDDVERIEGALKGKLTPADIAAQAIPGHMAENAEGQDGIDLNIYFFSTTQHARTFYKED